MPVVNCPDCREPVDIDADWYGRRVECSNCGGRFTARRDRDDDDRDDGDDDRPRRPRRRRMRYDDAPPPKSGNAALWITLTVVGVLVVLPVLGCIGYFAWFANAKQQFAATWSDSTAGINGEVTAAFPLPPSPHFLSTANGIAGEQQWYSNRSNTTLEAELVAGFIDYPAGSGDPLTTQYKDIRDAVEAEFMDEPFGPAVPTEKRTTAYGYPAMEATYPADSGGYTLRVVHVNDRPPGQPVRVVLVLAGGTHLKPEDKQKFLNGVRIGKQ